MDLPLLQSKSRVSSTYIPPHPTQLHPRFNRQHPNPNHNSNFPAKKNLIVFSLALFSLLFLLSAALRLRHRSPDLNPSPNHYGVVIYASPDRSQVHVFTSLDAGSESSRKVGQGLLWLGGDSERIRGMVSELVEFAKGRVLRSEWEKTKVQMVGDGELERLEMGIVAAFLDTCRGVLRGSGFLFKDEWVTTLGGKQEAVYDWVAANYALGKLGKEPQRTDGIVKLGGTSMQITFSSLDPDLVPVSWVVKLAGVTYNLYTESMPYFGQDAMRKSLDQMYNSKNLQTFSSSEEDIARDPCLPKGYKFTINATNEKVVAGNFSLCISHVRRALLKRKQDKNCMQPPCEIVSSYSIKLRGKPVPLNNFFFISEFFGLVPKASLSELEAAGHHYCEDDWHKLKSQHNNIDDLDLIKYCFASAYVVALLHDNFGISMIVKRIGFANPGGNVPPTWIYGAFLLQILQEPVEMERVNTEEIVGNDTVTYLSLFTVLLIAVLGAIFLLKYRKPQLKTVYDLQKGQYLVTRLPK